MFASVTKGKHFVLISFLGFVMINCDCYDTNVIHDKRTNKRQSSTIPVTRYPLLVTVVFVFY